jgi:excisionase family DNA binding protein
MFTSEEQQKAESTPRKMGRPPKKPRNITDPALPLKRERVACSIKDSANLLGIGVTSLYQRISAGEIKSFCIGTRRLIAYEELLRFVRSLSA